MEMETGLSEDIVHAIAMSFHGSCNCSNSSLGFANPHCDVVEPQSEPEPEQGGAGESVARRCSRQTTK